MKKRIGKLLFLAMLICLSAIVPVQGSSAREIKPVPIDKDHFPDKNVRKAIKDFQDKNKDGVLSKKEIKKATYFYVGKHYGAKIQPIDLTGLEYLPYIREVVVEMYQLKPGALKKAPFTGAKKITLNGNLSNLDFGKCKNLEELSCGMGKGIGRINVRQCKKLKKLEIFGREKSKLAGLDISRNDRLKSLEIHEQIRCDKLVLQGADSLNDVYITAEIKNLSIRKCPSLEHLRQYSTCMVSVMIRQCPKLNAISMQGDSLETFSVGNVEALKELSLYDIHLDMKELEGFTQLESLWISRSENTELNLNAFPNLKSLSVHSCEELTTLVMDRLSQLQELYLMDCPKLPTPELDPLDALTKLIIENCPNIKRLKLSDMASLQGVYAEFCLEELDLSGLNNCRELLSDQVGGGSCILMYNPLKRIIVSKDISQEDLAYIQSQLGTYYGEIPEIVYI